jgi:hypothetical protein
VNFKKQNCIIDQIKLLCYVKSVKSVFGTSNILVVFESKDLQKIKGEIDNNLHSIDGIENLMVLISLS